METRRQIRPDQGPSRAEDRDNLPPALRIDVATGNQIEGRSWPPDAGQRDEVGSHDPGNAISQIRQRHGNGQRRAETPPPTRRNPLNHYY